MGSEAGRYRGSDDVTGGVRRAGIIGEFRGVCRLSEPCPVQAILFSHTGQACFRNPVFAGTGETAAIREHFRVRSRFLPFFSIGGGIMEHRLNPIGKKHRHETEMTGRR